MKERRYKWYKIDNSAIVYQMIITPYAQSLFRLGATLAESVKKPVLVGALEKAFQRHPYFRSELKRGFFRPYFDENPQSFVVEKDDGKLLNLIDFKKNNRYVLRVTYYGRRIFIDFFHGLCDGYGAMEFLKTVLFYYCELSRHPIEHEMIKTLADPYDEEETEDAFAKYYLKPSFTKGVNSMASGRAFPIRDKTFHSSGYGLIQAKVNTSSLLSASRLRHCSITVLLTALMLDSVAKVYGWETENCNYVAFIPINLRKRYPSKSLRNFTIFAKCVIPKGVEVTFENMVPIVRKLLQDQLNADEMELKMGFSSLLATMPLLKYMPLFIKSFISQVSRRLSAQKQTFILSNLGHVEMDDNDLVKEIFFNLNCNKRTPDNVAVVSYGEDTIISFTRKIISTEIEKEFCRSLAKLVGKVEVISNFREESDAL